MADDYFNDAEQQIGQTPLGTAAGAIHELFISYMGAGFTEDQALKLLGFTLAAAARQDSDD